MNAIGFVFCILTILSFGAIVSLEKQVSAHRLRSSYLGHIAANREILDQTTSKFYASLKRASNADEKEKKEKAASQNKELPPPPPINPNCARLNLFSLVDRDIHEDPFLYETAASLLRIFYGDTLFGKKARAEYKFLDAFLKEVRFQIVHQEFTVLEKVSFKDPQFRMIYYKMLKGTKTSDVLKGIGYPSLLDYIKIEPAPSKLCLYHAHPNLLSIFFTTKGAAKLYQAMHTPKAPPITQESIERICHEIHAPLLDPAAFDLFDIAQNRHQGSFKSTFIGVDPDSHISLRKVVSLPKSNDLIESEATKS